MADEDSRGNQPEGAPEDQTQQLDPGAIREVPSSEQQTSPWSSPVPQDQPPQPQAPPAAPGPPPPPYGHQGPYGQPAAQGQYPPQYGYGPAVTTSSSATVVGVCGIASLVLLLACGLGVIAAIVALVKAGSAEREIVESGGRLQGLGLVNAGRICAWITIGLAILTIAAFAVMVFGMSSGGGGAFSTGTY